MSTFIIHLLIPPLMVLTTGFFRARYVWAWIWVGVVGDLDYVGWWLYVNGYVPLNTHRAIFHNLWLFFVLAAIAYARFRRYRQHNPSQRNPFQAYAQTRAGAGWLLSSYYYFTHLLLDSFQGGVVPFWPLWDRNVYFEFALLVNTKTQEVETHAEAEAVPGGAPELMPVYPWLDSEQFAFLLLLFASLMFGYAVRRLSREVRTIRAVRAAPPNAPVGPVKETGARAEQSSLSPPKTTR